MGGDEFCALWTSATADEAAVRTQAALEALCEEGEAFAIGCSYGSVLLPNETRDPTDALRTADRRMYVRKGSARVSAGRQSSDVLLGALAERHPDLRDDLDRVAELACTTARVLGVPEEEIEVTRRPRCCTTSARWRSPTRSWTSRGRSTTRNPRSSGATRSSVNGSSRHRRRWPPLHDSCARHRALRWSRIPGRLGGSRDPSGFTNRVRLRRLRRDGARARLPRGVGQCACGRRAPPLFAGAFDPGVVEAFVTALDIVNGGPISAASIEPELVEST